MATITYDVTSGKPLIVGYVEETGVNTVILTGFTPEGTGTTVYISIEGIGLLDLTASTTVTGGYEFPIDYTITVMDGKFEAFLVEKNTTNTYIRKSQPFEVRVKRNGRIATMAKEIQIMLHDWFSRIISNIESRVSVVEEEKEDKENKIQSIPIDSNDTETYPSTQAVVEYAEYINNKANTIVGNETSTTYYPSTKAVADYIGGENKFFFCTYSATGEGTTYTEVTAAVNAGKTPVLIHPTTKQFFIYSGLRDSKCRFSSLYSSGDQTFGAEVGTDNKWTDSYVYVECSSLKTDTVGTGTSTNYPSTKGVVDYVAEKNNNIAGVYVSGTSGSDTGTGTASDPFKTINHALTVSSTVYVEPGTYTENIAKSDRNNITISLWLRPDYVVGNEKPYIKISGKLISFARCKYVTLSDIWVDNSTSHGIYLLHVDNATLTNCIVSNCTANNTSGYSIRYSNVKLYDCVAHDIKLDGFSFHYEGTSEMFNCIAYNCGDDGVSHHEHCNGYIEGGEYYNNTKGGIASPTYGATVNINGAYSHNNAYGLYTITNAASGVSTTNISNCVFKDNTTKDIRINGCNAVGWNNSYDTKDVASGYTFTEYSGDKFYWVTKGTTTYQQISDAVASGKTPIMIYPASSEDEEDYYANELLTYAKNGDNVHYFTGVSGRNGLTTAMLNSSNSWSVYVDGIEWSSNKKSTITGNESSTTYFPSTKAVADYAIPREQLWDAGIKSESWSTTTAETTVTTIEDKYKSQRPTPATTGWVRYWEEFTGGTYFKHDNTYRVTFTPPGGTATVYSNLCCLNGVLQDVNAVNEVEDPTNDIAGCWALIGNRHLYDDRYLDTGEPFCIMIVEHGGSTTSGEYYYSNTVGNGILLTSSAGSYKIKIESATLSVTNIPKAISGNYGKGDPIYESVANGSGSSYQTNSIGQGNLGGRATFNIGISNINTGYGSVAMGYSNNISAHYSLCTGTKNTVTGNQAGAIGYNNEVTGQYGFAAGNGNNPSSNAAVCLGMNNTASGFNSVAMGYANTASGHMTHVSGYHNTTSGMYSFSHGNQNTAQTYGQTVFGEYNALDTGGSTTTRGNWAFVIGNGTATEDENGEITNVTRSNAHTLDWTGEAEYAGDVIANGCGGSAPISMVALNAVSPKQIYDQSVTYDAAGLGQKIAEYYPTATYSSPKVVIATIALYGSTAHVFGCYRPSGNCWLLALEGARMRCLYKDSSDNWSWGTWTLN